MNLKTSTYAVNYGGKKNCQTDAVYNFLSGLPSPPFRKIKFSGVGRGDSRGFSVNIEEEAYRSFVIF